MSDEDLPPVLENQMAINSKMKPKQSIFTHSPEPWEYDSFPEPHVRTKGGKHPVLSLPCTCGPKKRGNLMRATACVNACKGMKHPDISIQSLIDAVVVMKARLEKVMELGACMKYADAVGGKAGVAIADYKIVKAALDTLGKKRGRRKKKVDD